MSTSFRRIQPLPLFETTWEASDLESLKDKPGVGDVAREVALPPSSPSFFFGRIGRSVQVNKDIWGVDWSPVAADDWSGDLSNRVLDFETSYLQLRLSVSSGITGDSILFGYNAPNHDPSEQIHAFTHLQIPSFGDGGDHIMDERATEISNHLIDGYAYARDADDPMETIKQDTRIALYGVGRTKNILITAQCLLLGGFPAQ